MAMTGGVRAQGVTGWLNRTRAMWLLVGLIGAAVVVWLVLVSPQTRFAVLFLSLLAGLVVLRVGLRTRPPQRGDARGSTTQDVYEAMEPWAGFVKVVLQMAIGVATVGWIAWHFLEQTDDLPAAEDALKTLLLYVAVGLASAAV